jgi:hypothetical protein
MSNFTLIIHPEDSTTDFLTKIYQNIENKIVVHSSTNIGQLIHLIEAAHRVIMCGHGDQDGLIGRGGYIINEDLASSLRHKTNSIFLWCNAADFVMKHDICGIFSGMFISEVGEAEMFGIQTSQLQIDESNQLFSELLGRELLSPTCEDIVQTHTNIIKEYSSLADMGNIIAAYNCKRWYVRSSLSSDVKVHHQYVKSISLHSHLLTWSGGCRQGAICVSIMELMQHHVISVQYVTGMCVNHACVPMIPTLCTLPPLLVLPHNQYHLHIHIPYPITWDIYLSLFLRAVSL